MARPTRPVTFRMRPASTTCRRPAAAAACGLKQISGSAFSNVPDDILSGGSTPLIIRQKPLNGFGAGKVRKGLAQEALSAFVSDGIELVEHQ
jgi:hypothetical protein